MPTETSTFTLSHWGVHEAQRTADDGIRLAPWAGDPDPSAIGLDLGSPSVDALRVRRPSFRQGWLAERALSRARRGQEAFVELPWPEAVEIVAGELARVIRERGNSAIYGGSYGWASAGRFHHAQSHLHRFLNTIGGYVQSRDSYSFGAASVIMPRIVGPMDDLLVEHTDWGTLSETHTSFSWLSAACRCEEHKDERAAVRGGTWPAPRWTRMRDARHPLRQHQPDPPRHRDGAARLDPDPARHRCRADPGAGPRSDPRRAA